MEFITKLPLLILFLIAGCSTTGGQYSSIETQSDQQLCAAYLANYSVLHSSDIASLNEGKKQYLIALLDKLNLRGLDRYNCNTVVMEKN